MNVCVTCGAVATRVHGLESCPANGGPCAPVCGAHGCARCTPAPLTLAVGQMALAVQSALTASLAPELVEAPRAGAGDLALGELAPGSAGGGRATELAYTAEDCRRRAAECMAMSREGAREKQRHMLALQGLGGDWRPIVMGFLELASCRERRGKQWADAWTMLAEDIEERTEPSAGA